MSAPAETALVVPVPEAEPLVGHHRRVLDHSAPRGVPAHVTVLYPFLPPDRVTGEAIEDVRGCLTAVEAFSCTFSDVRWFGEDAVWLAPEPDGPFRALTEAVWRRFPDQPPYRGAFRTSYRTSRSAAPGSGASRTSGAPAPMSGSGCRSTPGSTACTCSRGPTRRDHGAR